MQSAAEQDRQYWQRVDEVFNAVLDVPPTERAARLDAICGSDMALRAEVCRLLESDGRVDADFLEPPATLLPPSSYVRKEFLSSITPELSSAQRWVGRRIAGFTMVRCLAVGGMGVVYEAVQDHPRRAVALKLMQSASASPQRLRRFVTEAEILADLHHPNVAQVYEAGVGTEGPDDVPFMALELIPGAASITEFVRQRKLDRRARLDLFLQVCNAVQYVHQRGVIHRDLKPANILVDAAGHPRVIDFGVARLVEGDTAARTRLTEVRQIVGTLAYTSPEQVRGNAAYVDTRCDVYALGVVLFDLLTGQLPYDVGSGNLAEAIRAIESAVSRRPGALDPSLRGDLETIVLKALEKQPDRRYPSVEVFAEDIRRHLRHQPILARPPSAAYQLRKFAQRNRTLVGGAIVAMIVSLIGAGTTAWKAVEATRERDRAQQAARKSERIAWFLQTVLSSADPRHADADVTIREALAQAAARAEAELAGEPDVLADVLSMVGSIFVRMKRLPEGEQHLRQALAIRTELYGRMNNLVANTMCDLAWALTNEHLDEIQQLFTDALDILRTLNGESHASVAVAGLQVAAAKSWKGDDAGAVAQLRQTLPVLKRERGERHAEVGFALATLANSLKNLGDVHGAEAAYREAIEVKRIADRPLELADTLSNFAKFLRHQNRHDEAAPFAAEAAEILTTHLGQDTSRCE